MASRLYETFRPSAVIGFGGYPALPALLAAQRDRIPTLIHEQNAVLGRVNRLMAGRVDAIATAYPSVERLPQRHAGQGPSGRQSGPRRGARAARSALPAADEDGIFRLLVTGGSQGAPILSEVVPEGLGAAARAFPPPAPGHPAMPRRGYRGGPRPLCRARHPRRPRHLYARPARPAGLVASRHRPRRRLDHRRADRGRPARDPRSAAERDRRSPDRQCPRDGARPAARG